MKSENLDKKIWQGLLGKNRKAQEALYKLYYSYGMSICLRYTSTRDEAKEILHDGFMVLFSKPEKFDPEQSFKPWFRRVLVNLCINLFNKQQKLVHQTGFEILPESKESQPSALDVMQYDELLKLIQRLPPSYRTVFNLYVLDGFSHEEIAVMLDISVGTSKSNLSRAKEKLRELIKPRTHEQGIVLQER
ncbi:RNA polymerase sigma factor [Algoriphagus sp. A40]|uniref:RNA polymerase sigma factor n=1 Tax=Algoriphagus sp. A40 TaxID=1945863 RepID=UPI0009864941|nr:RNA polymerase sigma factor [Algoriphagus sp. A40]OOG76853.1 RNA polymerase subunit sigma-70 [Algoriphagus sp. A40]